MNRQDSQGSHVGQYHFSEPPKLGLENRGTEQYPFGRAYSTGVLQWRSNRYINDASCNTRNTQIVHNESRSKANLAKILLKLFEKESSKFTGTGNRSWGIELQTFIELAETHKVRNPETLLNLYDEL